eukprot:gene9016-9979_t
MSASNQENNVSISSKGFPSDVKSDVREIGAQGIWSLSSCKPGFGIDQLRDDNFDTYWQSDGPQPHLINIQFRRKTLVKYVSIYTDFKADESYTPNKISVRVGNDFHDLRQIELVELDEPTGWINIELKDSEENYLKTFMIQLAILGNHQNGRDTHLRQIKVFAPNLQSKDISMPSTAQFSSIELSMYSRLR